MHLRLPSPVELLQPVVLEVNLRLPSLRHGACLLLFFRLGHVSIRLGRGGLSLEELVHLAICLGDHLGGLGPAPLVARGGVLLGGGVDEGGQVPGGQVGQLYRQVGVLEDGIGQDLLLPQADVGVALQYLGVLGDVAALLDLASGLDVLHVEQSAVLVALVPEAEVDAGAVLCGCPHEVGLILGMYRGSLRLGLCGISTYLGGWAWGRLLVLISSTPSPLGTC